MSPTSEMNETVDPLWDVLNGTPVKSPPMGGCWPPASVGSPRALRVNASATSHALAQQLRIVDNAITVHYIGHAHDRSRFVTHIVCSQPAFIHLACSMA